MRYDETAVGLELPAVGFYHHYKHDPEGPVNEYAYYVFNVGHHTEEDCRQIDKFTVQYLPLYDSYVYWLGKGRISDSRPLSMFMSSVEKDGATRSRFTRILDPNVIEKLKAQGRAMYPDRPFF